MSTVLTAPENRLTNGNGNNNTVLAGDAFTNPAYYEHVKQLAGLLANGAFTPKHLISAQNQQRTLATCMRVVIQALQWDMNIFAVADETYEVHGRLGYQGKLVIAVVNARAKLKGRLKFEYTGSGAQTAVKVTGQFADEDEPRSITLSVAQAKTANDMWTKDPEQKLAYSGAIKWARRNCPELVMGVRTDDDIERIVASEAPLPRLGGMDDLADKLSGLGGTVEGKAEATAGETLGEEITEDVSQLQTVDPAMLAFFDGCELTPEAIEAVFQKKMAAVSDLQALVAAKEAMLAKLPKEKSEAKKTQGTLVK